MTQFRWFKNPLVWLALLAAGLVILGLTTFSRWKTGRVAELTSGSEVVETPRGKVEFAREGSGPVVLVLHGAPGGYDQGLAVGRFLVEAGFTVLAPSRPGYLRTPLVSGILPEQQARLFAALLDQLQIPSVAVVAFGEGAASAVTLTAAFPDKVNRLVLLSPVLQTRNWKRILTDKRLPGRTINAALTGDGGAWALDQLVRWDPAQAMERGLEVSTTLKPFDQFSQAEEAVKIPAQREWLAELVRSVTPVSGREIGIRNDLVQSLQFPSFAFTRIAVPVMVVRGEVDALTTSGDAELAAKAPNFQRVMAQQGGYFLMLGPESEIVLKQVVEFLKSPP